MSLKLGGFAVVRSLAVAAMLAALAQPAARACSIPVFRYALENWPADDYDVYIFHRGGIPADKQPIIDWLEHPTVEGEATGNYQLHLIDLNAPTSDTAAMQEAAADDAAAQSATPQEPPEVPWMVVRYPEAAPVQGAVWSVPLTAENARLLVDSPARREIAKRLLDGESAVWLLLEGGDKAADTSAAQTLDAALKQMMELIELPEIEPEDMHRLAGGEEAAARMRVGFSILRIAKTDPQERAFVNMLVRSEPDLEGEYAHAPVAFPFYGRGRALYALVGPGINEENIADLCAFVAGFCSCEIKSLNPGLDMLFAANWDSVFESGWGPDGQTAPALPTLASLAVDAPPSHLGRNILLVGAAQALLVLVIGAWLVLRRRPS